MSTVELNDWNKYPKESLAHVDHGGAPTKRCELCKRWESVGGNLGRCPITLGVVNADSVCKKYDGSKDKQPRLPNL